MNQNILLDVFIFLAAASIMVPLASRFKLGSVIGYLVIGILIGPFGLKLIENAKEIMHFAEFGVIMMLFLIGLELEPINLWNLKRLILGLGGLQVLLTTALFTAIGLLLGFSWPSSLAVGMALSLSSTALVLQILQEKNLLKTPEGEASFAVLLFQDVAVIPILIILPLIASNHDAIIPQQQLSVMAQLPKGMHALLTAGVIGFVILAGHFLSRHLFLMVARANLREVFTAFSLALVVGVTLLMNIIGVSPALGAFISGVVLANSQYKHTVLADIQPFKGLLLGLFFISVGMGMNFSLLEQYILPMTRAVLALIAIKAIILCCLGRLFKLSKIKSIGLALGLAQGGEFAFVLFQYAQTIQVIKSDTASFFTLAVALSMLITPFLMLFYHRFVVPKFNTHAPAPEYDTIKEHNDIILAGYGRFGQIIGRFLNAEGIKATILEKNPEEIELLRKYGYHCYFGDANRADILKSAGAAKAKLLIVTVGNPDINLAIVKLAKQEFPHLKIFARARNRTHAYELNKAGVDYFKRELFDSSLTMTQEVLKYLGYKPYDIEKKALAFEMHDEAILRQSFNFFEKETELITFTRKAKGELERILQSH